MRVQSAAAAAHEELHGVSKTARRESICETSDILERFWRRLRPQLDDYWRSGHGLESKGAGDRVRSNRLVSERTVDGPRGYAKLSNVQHFLTFHVHV